MTDRDARNRRTTNLRQRKKQQHLLDVKVRASTERHRRMSAIFGFTFKLILITALAIGAYIGGKEGLRRYLWENPDYFIREPKFTTDGTLTREQVLRAGGIVEGANIFLLNLRDARAAIEKLPQVENAEVTRTLPNKLAVNVTERRPVAWLVSKPDEDPTASDKAFLIDARGVVMKSKVKLEEYLNFPSICEAESENLLPGERVTSPEIQAALELIRLTGDSTKFHPRLIDLSKRYCLVVTDHRRARFTFALQNIEAQLARLDRYIARAAEDMREIQTINLLVERNTPVTFVEPLPAEPPANPPAPGAAAKTGAKAATPAPLPAAVAAARTATAFNSFLSTPAPSGRKSAVQKKPFRLNP